MKNSSEGARCVYGTEFTIHPASVALCCSGGSAGVRRPVVTPPVCLAIVVSLCVVLFPLSKNDTRVTWIALCRMYHVTYFFYDGVALC